MYRGFKVSNFSFSPSSKENLFKIGKNLYNDLNASVRPRLKNYINSDNSLDGSSIQNAWFPQLKADIFISHSHKDKDLAITLAGWLKSEFNLNCFIDSCVWGYSNELLKEIDNLYCRNGENSYSYQKRIYSTSHVHMMLSTALSTIMDKTECLFFLNTPKSIMPYTSMEQTESPWIYFEIAMSQIIRKKEPTRFLTESLRYYSDGGILEKSIKVKYEVDLTHLTEIDGNELAKWATKRGVLTEEDALDLLYTLKPPKKNSDSLHG